MSACAHGNANPQTHARVCCHLRVLGGQRVVLLRNALHARGPQCPGSDCKAQEFANFCGAMRGPVCRPLKEAAREPLSLCHRWAERDLTPHGPAGGAPSVREGSAVWVAVLCPQKSVADFPLDFSGGRERSGRRRCRSLGHFVVRLIQKITASFVSGYRGISVVFTADCKKKKNLFVFQMCNVYFSLTCCSLCSCPFE